MFRKLLIIILIIFSPATLADKPKLILQITVDQLRGDMVSRFGQRFGAGGFRYLVENGLEFAAQLDPDEFTRWVFPRLFHSRIPRYEAIAGPHGYTVTSHEVAGVRDERDFLDLLENAIARKAHEPGE